MNLNPPLHRGRKTRGYEPDSQLTGDPQHTKRAADHISGTLMALRSGWQKACSVASLPISSRSPSKAFVPPSGGAT